MRLFAAIDLSPETQDTMAAEQKRIGASLRSTTAPLKWVRPDHAHLPLVFLGDVDATTVPSLVDTVSMDVAMPPFDSVFSGIGVFPRHSAPRVLRVGIDPGGSQLRALQIELLARVSARGIPIETRDFHPHLTRPVDQVAAVGSPSRAFRGAVRRDRPPAR